MNNDSESAVRHLHRPERIYQHEDRVWVRTAWTLGFIAAVFAGSLVIAWALNR